MGRCGFYRRLRSSCLAGHVGFRAEQSCEQARNRQVHVESFPVQAIARTQDLDRVQLVVAGSFQPLCQPGRKREDAAVGKVYDDPAVAPII